MLICSFKTHMMAMNIKQMYCNINMIESSIILKVWWGLGWPPSKGQTPPSLFILLWTMLEASLSTFLHEIHKRIGRELWRKTMYGFITSIKYNFSWSSSIEFNTFVDVIFSLLIFVPHDVIWMQQWWCLKPPFNAWLQAFIESQSHEGFSSLTIL